MNTGQLLSTLNLRIVIGSVSGATLIDENLLLEDAEFLKVVRSADNLPQVIDWANENY
jgi:hypothetical protein